MFDYLKALAARFAGRPLHTFLPPPPPEDPSLGVREPRHHGPGGKSSAVAVSEPVEPVLVDARGALR